MTPITGRRRATVQDFELPGDFCFWHISEDGQLAYFAFVCPCGTDNHSQRNGKKIGYDSIPVRQGDKVDDHWKWDGNLETPTLWPSIQRMEGCRWHGYLTRGVWQLDRGDV